jgi:hypothetical protein
VNTFLQVSDYYLVAQAHAGNHIIVSHEVPSSSIRKIKIPDARIGWLHRILRLSRIFAEHAERIETIRAHSRFSPLGQVFGVNPGRNFVRTRTVQGQPALFWRFDSDVGLDLSYCEIPNT